jgi:cold shock CspA family protein
MKAEVRWFDNRSGEGFIRILDESSHLFNKSIYVHWSAVDQCQTDDLDCHSKHRWVVLFKKQAVNVDVIEDSHFVQISKVTGRMK